MRYSVMTAPSPLDRPVVRVHLPHERRQANPTRLSQEVKHVYGAAPARTRAFRRRPDRSGSVRTGRSRLELELRRVKSTWVGTTADARSQTQDHGQIGTPLPSWRSPLWESA